MAAKRILDGDDNSEQPVQKRLKPGLSFATVIKEAMMVKSLESFFSTIEPTLRKVVREEVELSLLQTAKSLQRYPSNKKVQVPQPSTLRLNFCKGLTLPVFTGTKIEDEEGGPLQIYITDTSGDGTSLPSALKVELVVVDGDFPSDDRDDWTAEEFQRNIVKERAGKRPLLTGVENPLTVRDGASPSVGDLVITDNSSWIRSRRFRIGARVVPGSCNGLRIREAVTERFTVKDHRGELYKKSYPPALNDEVWRLKKIGKDGAFHKRLSENRISTVQGFLKHLSVKPQELREMMGIGMSDRMWEVTIKHAQTCALGNKLYLHRHPQAAVLLNPICQVVGVVLDGIPYSPHTLAGSLKSIVEHMKLDAFKRWTTLQEIEESTASTLLPQICSADGLFPQYTAGHSSRSLLPALQNAALAPEYQLCELDVVEDLPRAAETEYSDWHTIAPNVVNAIRQNYVMTEFSSDEDDSTLSQNLFHGF